MTLLLIANLGYAWGEQGAGGGGTGPDTGPHIGWYIRVRGR